MLNTKNLKLFSGPLAALLVFMVCHLRGWNLPMSATLSMFAWMAIWWLTEAVSIYYTSLLPLIILPVFGVMKMEEVSPLYMNEIIFLFIGGFLLAYAMEKSGLHHRIALFILRLTPATGNGVLGGLMFATFVVSMFINNTATCAMLLPAVLGLNDELRKQDSTRNIATPLLLGLAFSSSIGGMATTIGTAPNLIFLSAYGNHFPQDPITFTTWLKFGMPIALLIQVAGIMILRLIYRKSLSGIRIESTFVQSELVKLGKTTRDEKIILGLIGFLFVGWLFKDDIDFGGFVLRGWTNWFPNPDAIKESTLMLFVCLAMYFIPSRATKKTLIDWNDFKKVPIGVIFLFGGGFALSRGIKESGLSDWITMKLEVVSAFHPFIFLIILVGLVTLLSEFASNVATMNILMAVIFNVLAMVNLVPQQVLIATAMAASVGFALPAATPPNSIVYGTELVPAREMIRAGLLLDLAGILIISLFCYFLVGYMF